MIKTQIGRPLRYWTAGAACLLGLAFSADASARGYAAIGGRPANGADAACFVESWGGVQNNCKESKIWVLALPYDSTGRTNIQVAVRGVAGTPNKVGCTAYAVDPNGENAKQSTKVWSARLDGKTEPLKMQVDAHGWGGVYVMCTMDSGTLLRNIHFNQGNVPL